MIEFSFYKLLENIWTLFKLINLISLQDMLERISIDGPSTEGMFRKAGNNRVVRECREKIDAGQDLDFSEISPVNCGALLKVEINYHIAL